MNLLISTLKIIFTFATVFFAALPFVFEYHTYLKDKEKKTANRRFRIMCFTMIYVAALTFALCALRDVITAVGGLSVISWLAAKLALPVRTAFFSDVVGALLINFAIGFYSDYCSDLCGLGWARGASVKARNRTALSVLRKKLKSR